MNKEIQEKDTHDEMGKATWIKATKRNGVSGIKAFILLISQEQN